MDWDISFTGHSANVASVKVKPSRSTEGKSENVNLEQISIGSVLSTGCSVQVAFKSQHEHFFQPRNVLSRPAQIQTGSIPSGLHSTQLIKSQGDFSSLLSPGTRQPEDEKTFFSSSSFGVSSPLRGPLLFALESTSKNTPDTR